MMRNLREGFNDIIESSMHRQASCMMLTWRSTLLSHALWGNTVFHVLTTEAKKVSFPHDCQRKTKPERVQTIHSILS